MIKEPNQPSSPWILVTNTIEADFFSHAIAQVGVPELLYYLSSMC